MVQAIFTKWKTVYTAFLLWERYFVNDLKKWVWWCSRLNYKEAMWFGKIKLDGVENEIIK